MDISLKRDAHLKISSILFIMSWTVSERLTQYALQIYLQIYLVSSGMPVLIIIDKLIYPSAYNFLFHVC